MRIIFFNIWQGKIEDKLLEFIRENSSDTDIFCFQELKEEIRGKINKILENFHLYPCLRGNQRYGDIEVSFDQGLYVKSNIKPVLVQNINTYKRTNLEPAGLMQQVIFNDNAFKLALGNLHGEVYPGSKLDTPSRLEQSKIVIESFKNRLEPKIIGGDFNLSPGTESVKIFEKSGYRNLIKDFNVKQTRNKFAWGKFPEWDRQYISDYIFVSPEIKVKNFEVPDVEISDHLPLILDFEI